LQGICNPWLGCYLEIEGCLEHSHASSNRSAADSDAASTFDQTSAAALMVQLPLHVNAFSSFILLTC